MKYVVVLYDGMADYPVPALGGKTPMMCAKKPNMDYLAKRAEVGLIRTVAQGLKPGSDVANMSVLGFDPMKYYTGRSPLEAASIGIDMKPTDVSLRTNLVTLSEDDLPYEQKTIEDYCADDISTEEAEILIKYIDEKLGTDEFKFYPGVSYRHCLIWDNGTTDLGKMTPPHDITGKVITEYLSTSENAKPLIELMKKSYDLLKDHPVNLARKKAGKRPANSIWLWGEGKRPALSPFEEIYGIKGAVVSAVDLIKGIGVYAGLRSIDVPGATGLYDTDYEGKVAAAIEALKTDDFVYLHIEASDEAGHEGNAELKKTTVEYLDHRVLRPLLSAADSFGEPLTIALLPDHPTPCRLKTHTNAPIPFIIYKPGETPDSVQVYDEDSVSDGYYGTLSGNEFIHAFFADPE